MSMTSLDAMTAARELAAIAWAISMTVGWRFSKGTRWFTRPMRSASCASMVRAVKISSLARGAPTMRGSWKAPTTSP